VVVGGRRCQLITGMDRNGHRRDTTFRRRWGDIACSVIVINWRVLRVLAKPHTHQNWFYDATG